MPDYIPPINPGQFSNIAEILARAGSEAAKLRYQGSADLGQGIGQGLNQGVQNYLRYSAARPPSTSEMVSAGVVPSQLPAPSTQPQKLISSAQGPGMAPGYQTAEQAYGQRPSPQTAEMLMETFKARHGEELAQLKARQQLEIERMKEGAAASRQEKGFAANSLTLNQAQAAKLNKILGGEGYKAGDVTDRRTFEHLIGSAETAGGRNIYQTLEPGTKNFDTAWREMAHEVDPAISSSVLRIAGQNNLQARRALRSVSGDHVSLQQLSAATEDLARIFKGGAADQETARSMSFQNLNADWNALQSRITSSPQDLNNPEVIEKVKSMLRDVISVDNEIINQRVAATEIEHAPLIQKAPKQWAAFKKNLSQWTADVEGAKKKKEEAGGFDVNAYLGQYGIQ